LISTLAAVAMIAAILGVQAFLISGGEKIQVATSGAGADELLSAAQTLARHSGTDVTFRPREHRTASAVEDAVRAGDAEVGLVRTGDGGWRLIGKTDRNQTAEVWVGMAVQQRTVAANAEAAGTSLAELTKGASVSYDLLTPGDTPYTVTRISRAVFGMLFYLVAILLGTMLATGIVEEKQNRIVEIVASTVSLRSLLLGKIAGLSVIGLGQVLVLGTVGVAGLAATGETGTLHQIAPGIGWFILFFIIGVVVLATLYAAAGAMSSRTEDIQSTTMPITMGVAAVFIASISVTGPALTVLSFLPLASTIAMPGRIVAGDAGWWQPLAALVISLLAAVAIIKMSELIYRRALLQTGGRLSVRQALRTQD
jgi:ABC-2 type transport system permease protein